MTTSRSRIPVRAALALLVVTAASTAPAFAAPAPAQHVRGTVTALAGNELSVATGQGSVRLALRAHAAVVGVVPASASDVKPGTFIGTANVADGSMARALEVVIFPNSMRGTGEGDYPWDLPAGGRSSAMTNGTVGAPNMALGSGSSMTNANVTHVSNAGQLVINVSYAGGTKTIAIPPNVPVVRIVPASLAALKPGARVFVVANHGSAARIIVGEQGAVPPM